MPTILGIDPGSRITGYGIIQFEKNRYQYIGSGCIKIIAEETAQRLQQIFSGLREIIASYQPQEIAIEKIFMQNNASSALKLGQARGVAIVAASLEGLPVYEYSARQVKQAVVGYGNAEKHQIQQMICRLLKLDKQPSPDAADALAIAICHANSHRYIP